MENEKDLSNSTKESKDPKSELNKRIRKLSVTNIRKKHFLLVGIPIILIIIIILIFLIHSLNSSNQVDKNPIVDNKEFTRNDLPTPTPTRLVATDKFNSFPYLENHEIYFNGKKITDTNNTITKFDYSENKEQFAYLTQTSPANDGDPTHLDIAAVYIMKQDEAPKKIYEQKIIRDDNSDHMDTVFDLGYSKDGERLAVTTTKNLYIYDSTGTPVESFSFTEKDNPNVYSFRGPIFSPDNSRLIIQRGYYEGVDYAIVDPKSKKIKDLNYGAYTSGEILYDWLANNTLEVAEFGYQNPEDKEYFLNLVSPETLKGTSFSLEDSVVASASDNNLIYFLSGANLIELDINSGKMRTIVDTKLSDISYFGTGMKFSKKNNMLFIGFDKYIYRIDLSDPNPKLILWKDNANLDTEYNY